MNQTEILGKKKKKIVLPEWLDKQVWSAFVDDRKERKCKMTHRAKLLLLTKLEGLHDQGEDVNKCILTSIEMGWKSVFPGNAKDRGFYHPSHNEFKKQSKPKEKPDMSLDFSLKGLTKGR